MRVSPQLTLFFVWSTVISWDPIFLPYLTWLVISPREGGSVRCWNNGPGQLWQGAGLVDHLLWLLWSLLISTFEFLFPFNRGEGGLHDPLKWISGGMVLIWKQGLPGHTGELGHPGHRKTRISRANKSNYRPASPTTDQDIFFSWFCEQSYWRLGAARVFVQRRTWLPTQYIRGCSIISRGSRVQRHCSLWSISSQTCWGTNSRTRGFWVRRCRSLWNSSSRTCSGTSSRTRGSWDRRRCSLQTSLHRSIVEAVKEQEILVQ